MTKINQDITILGCGLSGMITALALAKNGKKITIIESKNTGSTEFFHDPRTTALTATSKNFFEKLGIWEHLQEITGPINDIYVLDNKAHEMLHFFNAENTKATSIMGYMVENSIFKASLFELVSNNPLITVIDQASYKNIENHQLYSKVWLNEGSEITSEALIICDGPNSSAKRNFFSADLIKSYNQSALTFIVRHKKPHQATAVEHFMPLGPFAILPLLYPNYSSIVWTVKPEVANLISGLPNEELTFLVQENFGPFLGKVTIEQKPAVFNLKAYITKQYYNKRIILAADSAHIIHPLAGQGLNQGIKDIEALSDIICKRGINDLSLYEYEKARKTDNRNMFEITDIINSIFSNNSSNLHHLRQIGFKIINKIPSLTQKIVQYAMGER